MQEKKKILHVAQSAGGVANYISMLLSEMQEYDYENILVLSEDYNNNIKNDLKNISKKIYSLPMQRSIFSVGNLKSIFKLKKIIKDEKPDIVYMHSSFAGAVGRIALLFNKKCKKVYNAHGWYFNAQISNKKKRIFKILEKILAKNTNMIINISQSEYESAIENMIAPKEKMCIINNGIDFAKFNSKKLKIARDKIRNQYRIKDKDIAIGVAARLDEQKDPLTFIKTMKILNEKYNNLKFMYIGTGNLEQVVIDYAKENQLSDRLIITGWIQNYEEYISALDIAVLPSKWEGFGLAIIDYMAARKPIVASNIGGIANIIKNGVNGFLVTPEDIQEFANKIEEYIIKPETAKEMVEKNYEYAIRNFNIKKVAKEHIKLFEKLLK